MARTLYLDDGPGEARGVVVLDGRPERLLLARASDRPEHAPGARLRGRVRRIDRALASAFVAAASELDAILPLTGEAARLHEGAAVEIEVMSPPRRGKGAVVRLIGPAEGDPVLLRPAPPLAEQLQAFAPGAVVVRGAEARATADQAEAEALAVVHRLPSGGAVSIEPTRALVAIDVDVGAARGDARRAAVRANLDAVAVAARLLRLKGLGGPAVIDLAGKGHDGEALKRAAVAAFAPDQPGVAFGPIDRFGLWALVLPRRTAPVAEILCSVEGLLTDESLAIRLLREIEGQAGPGQRVEARASPKVALAAEALAPHLLGRIGARFRIVADPVVGRDAAIVAPRSGG